MLYDSGDGTGGARQVSTSQPVTGFAGIDVVVSSNSTNQVFAYGSARIAHPRVGVQYQIPMGGPSATTAKSTTLKVDSASELSTFSPGIITQVIGYR